MSNVATSSIVMFSVTLLLPFGILRAQLDETWVVSVGGQSAQVRPDGTFRLPNLSAVDVSPVDFLGDPYLRLTGVSRAGSKPRYCYSEFFRVRQGGNYKIQSLTFTERPPPLTEAIRLSAPRTVLEKGEPVQLGVVATLSSGEEEDVTPATSWTTYRSSNAQVVTVSADGVVVTPGIGTAFVTAMNQGATSVLRVTVVESTSAVRLEGFAETRDGALVPGAVVSLLRFGFEVVADENGFFVIEEALPVGEPLVLIAEGSKKGARLLGGLSLELSSTESGLIDVGILVMHPEADLLSCDEVANGSFERGSSPGGSFRTLGGGSGAIEDWVVTGHSVDYIGGWWQHSHGSRSLDLNGSRAGGVRQTLATVPGTVYLVEFDMAGNTDDPPRTKLLRVQAAGQSGDFSFSTAGWSRSSMGWVRKRWAFAASQTSTTIEFVSRTSASGFGPALDHVRAFPIGGCVER